MSDIDNLTLDLEAEPVEPVIDQAAEPVAPVVAEPAEPPAWMKTMESMGAAMERIASRPDPQPNAPAQPPMSAEQLRELNERLSTEIVGGNALGVITEISQRIADQRMAAFRQEAEPYMSAAADASVEGFIDRFRSRKKDDDQLYKHVVGEFEKEFDPKTLVGKSAAERQRIANLHWQAAKATVLEKKVVASRPSTPPGASAGGGTGMGRSSAAGAVVEMTEAEKRQLYRYLPKDVADAEIARIESGEAGIA